MNTLSDVVIAMILSCNGKTIISEKYSSHLHNPDPSCIEEEEEKNMMMKVPISRYLLREINTFWRFVYTCIYKVFEAKISV